MTIIDDRLCNVQYTEEGPDIVPFLGNYSKAVVLTIPCKFYTELKASEIHLCQLSSTLVECVYLIP